MTSLTSSSLKVKPYACSRDNIESYVLAIFFGETPLLRKKSNKFFIFKINSNFFFKYEKKNLHFL